MTSKEYIEVFTFEYIEVYSLLRNITKEHFDHFRGTKQQLIETGLPHPTAQRTHAFGADALEVKHLKEILKIEFKEQYDWMCWPVFREMVVFYDKNRTIVSLLNICLSCDRIEDENKKNIKTDFKTFDELRIFFKNLGHSIER